MKINSKNLQKTLLISVLAWSLLGCGRRESTILVAPPPPIVATTPQLLSGLPTGSDPQLLAQVSGALNQISHLSGEVRFVEYGAGKEEHGSASFYFRRTPFSARIDVAESNRLLAAGTSILWTGGDSVKVKRKGLPVTLTFPADHSLTTSVRGYRLDQTDIFSMGKVLLVPGAQVRQLGRFSIENNDRILVDLISPGSMIGITRERIGIDPNTFIPTYREMYAGAKLVHRGIGAKLTVNRPIKPEVFTL